MEDNVVARVDKDKFQSMCHILADTVRAYFYGAHPQSTIINTHACYTVIHDLATYYKKHHGLRRVEFPSRRKIFSGKNKTESLIRDIANNLRHADKNSTDVFPAPFALAHAYLAVAILDFLELKRQLLAAEIIKQRDVSSCADLGMDRNHFTVPKKFGPFKKIGPFSLGNRPVTEEEEKRYFEKWTPHVDKLSSLFIVWHTATQPARSPYSQSIILPVKVSLASKTEDAIDDSRERGKEWANSDENFFTDEEHLNTYISSQMRFHRRNLMIEEMRRHSVDYTGFSLSDYYTVAVNLPVQDQAPGTVTSVPMEGKFIQSETTDSRRRILTERADLLKELELRLIICS